MDIAHRSVRPWGQARLSNNAPAVDRLAPAVRLGRTAQTIFDGTMLLSDKDEVVSVLPRLIDKLPTEKRLALQRPPAGGPFLETRHRFKGAIDRTDRGTLLKRSSNAPGTDISGSHHRRRCSHEPSKNHRSVSGTDGTVRLAFSAPFAQKISAFSMQAP